jgi:hypothetical protein
MINVSNHPSAFVTLARRFLAHPPHVCSGLFAVTELMAQTIEPAWARVEAGAARLRLPDRAMWRRLVRPQAIGAAIGTFEGVTPGAGGTIAAFLSYNEARRWSKHPEEFGKGSVEGVAAPECANNVVTGTALVPLLGLGIPVRTRRDSAGGSCCTAWRRGRCSSKRAPTSFTASTPACSSPTSRCCSSAW